MARTDTLDNFLTDVANSIRTKKGTTNSIPASNFDTEIESIETGGGSEPISEDYITDGLISWWEGEDDVDKNGHWNSRVGTDYIYQYSVATGTNTTNKFYDTRTSNKNSYISQCMYSLVTHEDYHKQGYTIEVVAKASNSINDSTSGGCNFFTFNRSGSPQISISAGGLFIPYNISTTSPTTFKNLYGKRLTFAINLTTLKNRGVSGTQTIGYALNGSKWYSTSGYSNNSDRSSDGVYCPVMCYYAYSGGTPYRGMAEINSIRIYNRKLTEEELKHNYEIDKARFKDIQDY